MDRLDFNTVKRYTSRGSYTVGVDLDGLQYWMDRQVKNGLILNPDFQRGYVWTVDQQIKYVEFMLKSPDSAYTPPIFLNHPGWMTNWEGEFVCVDGLQRITALRKFVDGNLEIFGGYTVHQIDNLRLYNSAISVSINNLKTRKEVLTWYIELNTGGTVHSDDEINRVKQLLHIEEQLQ